MPPDGGPRVKPEGDAVGGRGWGHKLEGGNMAAWVYIMANRRFGTVYVGATGDLIRRVWEHKNEVVPGFTKEHHCHLLVYFEEHQNMHRAMQREHNIKHWVRAWKDELIEKDNPEWDDLYFGLGIG